MGGVSDNDIREWFKDHVASYEIFRGPICEFLRWKKPGTSCYLVDYIVKDGFLIVTGDLGNAVYKWLSPVCLQDIASYSLDYFHSKCVASEGGRSTDWYEWSEEKAKKRIHDSFKDTMDCKGYKKFLDAEVPLHDVQEFKAWLITGDSYDMFGQDWWEWLPGIGNEIPIRCRAHLIGLKMAMTT